MDNLVKIADRALITLANEYRFAPGERIERACVSSRMQLWCHSGQGSVRVDDKVYEMVAGSILIMPWNHRICYQAARSNPMYVSGIHLMPHCEPPEACPWFQVSHDRQHPLHAQPWLQDRRLPGLDECLHRQLHLNHPLFQLSNYICSLFQQQPIDEFEMRMLSQNLLYAWQRLLTQKTKRLPAALERACNVITQDLSHQRSLEEYAGLAACSPSTLNRQAQQHLGLTLLQWQRQQQLLAASDQLRSSRDAIQDIAQRLGFEDPLYFSRCFKQAHGTSPRRYRELYALM